MSAPAIIPQADLTRMAKVAKTHGVAITTEINGRKFTVSPVTPDIHMSDAVDSDLAYGGNSLKSWRNRLGHKTRGNP